MRGRACRGGETQRRKGARAQSRANLFPCALAPLRLCVYGSPGGRCRCTPSRYLTACSHESTKYLICRLPCIGNQSHLPLLAKTYQELGLIHLGPRRHPAFVPGRACRGGETQRRKDAKAQGRTNLFLCVLAPSRLCVYVSLC